MLIWPCMSGHLAWLLFSDKIFFHAFQVGADAAPQAGAAPLSADMAFKDMTSHCEALTVGKQQKMSAFMSFQQSVQASGLPGGQPHDMELALFQDQQLPQVQYLSFSRPFSHRIHFKMNVMQNKVLLSFQIIGYFTFLSPSLSTRFIQKTYANIVKFKLFFKSKP